jgi:DNA-binding CsgD family transcriptional regulator/pimeloyl-ACP methyl ester carboxylesterase
MDAPPVQYVTTNDGYSIAYTICGEGFPLVLVPYVFNHVQLNWRSPGLHPWLEALAGRFRFVHYDSRGLGMSKRGLGPDHCLEDYLNDLAAVVDRVGISRFILMAWGAFGHVAVRFATANPDRVQALILKDCSVSLHAFPSAHVGTLPGENWEVFLRGVVMSGTPSQEYDLTLEIARQAVTQNDWQDRAKVFAASTVEHLLPQLIAPTLVLQGADSALLAREEVIQFASLIPESRLVVIRGGFPGDRASGIGAIENFTKSLSLSMREVPAKKEVGVSDYRTGLSPREVEVLHLLAAGKSNQQIADALVISPSTVLHHVTNILTKTGCSNRTEAAAYAHRNGLS